MTVLDTDFLVAIDLEDPAALALSRDLDRAGLPLRVPAAVWLEFFAGITPARREELQVELTRRTQFHAFGRAEADKAIVLWQQLERLGRPLAWHDLQVAATALALGEDLVSNDKAFRHVPGLAVKTF